MDKHLFRKIIKIIVQNKSYRIHDYYCIYKIELGNIAIINFPSDNFTIGIFGIEIKIGNITEELKWYQSVYIWFLLKSVVKKAIHEENKKRTQLIIDYLDNKNI